MEFVQGFCSFLDLDPETEIDPQIFDLINGGDKFSSKMALNRYKISRSEQKLRSTIQGVAQEDAPPYGILSDEEYTFVPKSNLRAGMGNGAFEFQSEQVVDTLAFKTRWILERGYNPKRLALISCVGDSMQPTLSDSDLALVDLRETDAADGLFAIGIDDTIRIKRLRTKLDGTISVISDNEKYETEHYTPEEAESVVRVIGRVVWACREFN